MICVVIKGPSLKAAQEQLQAAIPYADLVELRLDLFEDLQVGQLKSPLPMIFTLRCASQGGNYQGDESERLEKIRKLIPLKPAYIDLESHVDPAFVAEIQSQIPVILSHHNFVETPVDIESVYLEMKTKPAALYKLAFKAHSTNDTLRLLAWVKKSPKNIIAISMDTCGQPSRIVGPVIGSAITYACLQDDLQTAPGQLSAKTLKETYHYKDLTPRANLYGLIGNPVTQSISDLTHNHVFQALKLPAVYVKMPVKEEELPSFMEGIRTLPFKGLSVTIPHKENIMKYLDQIDETAQAIGAVNTIVWKDGQLKGYNTDGAGALDALEEEMHVRGQKVLILGAGGAAKAIAYEAIRRGAHVTLLNRTLERAKKLADDLGCQALPKDQMPSEYAILINATSEPLPIDPQFLIPSALIMDISIRPQETLLLKHAKEKGCKILPGYHMFREQAARQFALWFKNKINLEQVATLLNAKIKTMDF